MKFKVFQKQDNREEVEALKARIAELEEDIGFEDDPDQYGRIDIKCRCKHPKCTAFIRLVQELDGRLRITAYRSENELPANIYLNGVGKGHLLSSLRKLM